MDLVSGCMYACMYVCMYVCVYVCAYVRACVPVRVRVLYCVCNEWSMFHVPASGLVRSFVCPQPPSTHIQMPRAVNQHVKGGCSDAVV